MSVAGGLDGDPGAGDVLGIRAAALRWREQRRRLLDRQDDLALAGGRLATMRGQAVDAVAEETLTVQGLIDPLVQALADGADLVDVHADAFEEYARRAGLLVEAEASARSEAVHAHGRAVDEATWCNPPAVLPGDWWQRPWSYPLDPPASFYTWLAAVDTLEQVHADWAALCTEREDWDHDVVSRLGAVADPPTVRALGGGWGSDLAQAGRRAADLAVALEAGEAAAALTERIVSGTLGVEERAAAVAQLEVLLAGQGQNDGFADAFFARTGLEETASLFAVISPVGVSAAGATLRLAFGTWAQGLARSEQEELGHAMWARQSTSRAPASELIALIGSPTLPADVLLGAARAHHDSEYAPTDSIPTAEGVHAFAVTTLVGLTEHPESLRSFLTPESDAEAQERIATWSTLPHGDLAFATAYAEAVTTAQRPAEYDAATRLVTLATPVLADTGFTGSDEAVAQLTRAYRRDFLVIGAEDNVRDSLDGNELADLEMVDVSRLVAATSKTPESAAAWTALNATAIADHGSGTESWDAEQRDESAAQVMKSSGAVVGAIQGRLIEEGRFDDEVAAYVVTAVAAGISVATLPAGVASGAIAATAGTGMSLGVGFVDNEGEAIRVARAEIDQARDAYVLVAVSAYESRDDGRGGGRERLEDAFDKGADGGANIWQTY
ncbi:hypothetical protein SAMN04489860_0807 [Paraoerskovia marina]|uniref:Uncharacterized protein n=1 Tax=Paraoerskovia marina TaxID=545619 RepID=A0A1H1PHN4_9CELL|nr:hypothetical protein [Paraoerskovia marina]SDS10597.1 hypothetical protein SAMN04489860_0807 [Paraoerskovia marina]